MDKEVWVVLASPFEKGLWENLFTDAGVAVLFILVAGAVLIFG